MKWLRLSKFYGFHFLNVSWVVLQCTLTMNCASDPFGVKELHKNEESQEIFFSGRNSTFWWILRLRGPNLRTWNQIKNSFIFKRFSNCLKEHCCTATFFFCIFRVDKVRLIKTFLNSSFAEICWVYESPKNLDYRKFQIKLLQRRSRNRCLIRYITRKTERKNLHMLVMHVSPGRWGFGEL